MHNLIKRNLDKLSIHDNLNANTYYFITKIIFLNCFLKRMKFVFKFEKKSVVPFF